MNLQSRHLNDKTETFINSIFEYLDAKKAY